MSAKALAPACRPQQHRPVGCTLPIFTPMLTPTPTPTPNPNRDPISDPRPTLKPWTPILNQSPPRSSQKDAAIAASSHLFADDASKFSVRAAPPPEAVNWTAVWTGRPQRVARKWVAAVLYAAAIIFPVGFFVGPHLAAVCEILNCEFNAGPWSCGYL